MQPFFEQAGFNASPEKILAVTPLIRERIKLLRDAVPAADFFFVDKLAPYDPAELIPLKKENRQATPRWLAAFYKLRLKFCRQLHSITIRSTKLCATLRLRSG